MPHGDVIRKIPGKHRMIYRNKKEAFAAVVLVFLSLLEKQYKLRLSST